MKAAPGFSMRFPPMRLDFTFFGDKSIGPSTPSDQSFSFPGPDMPPFVPSPLPSLFLKPYLLYFLLFSLLSFLGFCVSPLSALSTRCIIVLPQRPSPHFLFNGEQFSFWFLTILLATPIVPNRLGFRPAFLPWASPPMIMPM